MDKKDFKNIMDNSFQIKYKGKSTELRCFTCGEPTELIKIRRKWRVKCTNQHKFKLIDFMISHINMRDGVAKAFLESSCSYKEV